MKKWQLIILMVIILTNISYATDEELFNPYIGDEESYSYIAGDEELNVYFINPTIADGVGAGGGGGGGSTTRSRTIDRGVILFTPYYDVLIEGIEAVYNVEDIIYFNITLINKGDTPDMDAVLVYYLLGPNFIKYQESKELFEEVPPTCPNATFNRYTHMCNYENGSTFEPFLRVLEKEIALPLNTVKGYWRVYVEYETGIQPLVWVYKSFKVGFVKGYKSSKAGISYTPLIGFSLIVLLFIFLRKRGY